jgi:diguanylate cyclase (GGDEF)-like protein
LAAKSSVCLLPHTDAEQAGTVAERIRQQVEHATASLAGTAVKAIMSLGIASTETFGYDLDTLMRRADTAVYAAKRRGRNQVGAAEVADAASIARMTVLGDAPAVHARQANG